MKENLTGEFFAKESELLSVLMKFDKTRYNSKIIKRQAQLFSEKQFILNFEKYLREIYEQEERKKE